MVRIYHASRLFQAAKHPKSFISLDRADYNTAVFDILAVHAKGRLPGFTANHEPRLKLDLAVAAGVLDYLLQPRALSTTPRTKASSSSWRENHRR